MANSNLIDVRMKLSGGRAVVSGLTGARKETEKFGTATSKASKVSKVAEKTTSRLTGAYRSLSTTAKAGLGFLGVGGVLAIESAVHASEELSKTTVGLTRNLDLSTNVASRWGAVAQAREIDSKSLTMSFTKLSRSMVEAGHKGGTLLTPFHQLGLSQEDAAHGAKDFEWGLMKVATAFGEAKGGAVRQAAAQQLLGRGYSTILPLFSEGTKGLKEQLHWADKYGVTLSTTTNDGIMEMVQAQRESKVAMLGLQVSLTRALMPAIEEGQDQLHEFIATLNDPKMSGEEKVAAIQKQFEGLETKLFQVIDRMAPGIAEHAGQLGLLMAKALWDGFRNSDILGKAVIATYLFKILGGGELLKSTLAKRYASMGTGSGKAFTAGLVLGSIGIGFLLAEELDKKTHGDFRQWGINAGQNFVNFLIKIVNAGIEEINTAMDKANAFAILGVEAPNIGTVGEVDFHDHPHHQPKPGRSLTEGGNPFHLGEPGSGFKPRSNPQAGIEQKMRGLWGSGGKGKFRTHGNHGAAGVRGREQHIHLEVDGKELAHVVVGAADDAAATR